MMKDFMDTIKFAALAALTMGLALGAESTENISVDKVLNHYPWDGKVDCVTTLSGLDISEEYEGVFTLSAKKEGASVGKIVTNSFTSVNGTYTNTFDYAELFGAGLYLDGKITVNLVKKENPGGVRLWENGLYWAECNVGATKAEDYGYYFWWGDTVGYKRNAKGNGWISVKDGTDFVLSKSNCPTAGKSNSELQELGYGDSNGKLVAEHDAATVALGAPWRMPTSAEVKSLIDNCATNWITRNGVNGLLVTGKGVYASKSIFFPAAGFGTGYALSDLGVSGEYASSTPYTKDTDKAYILNLSSSKFNRGLYSRYYGFTVRPVRAVSK